MSEPTTNESSEYTERKEVTRKLTYSLNDCTCFVANYNIELITRFIVFMSAFELFTLIAFFAFVALANSFHKPLIVLST